MAHIWIKCICIIILYSIITSLDIIVQIHKCTRKSWVLLRNYCKIITKGHDTEE